MAKYWAIALIAVCVLSTCGDDTPGTDCQTTCPGCCLNNVCLFGSAPTACGTKGASCIACNAGQSCTDGQCVMAGTCPRCTSGCCLGGVCQPGTLPAACGMNGQACTSCAAGKRCIGGRCEVKPPDPICGQYNCNGCCLDTRCIDDTNPQRCGIEGSPCKTCVGARSCQGGICSFSNALRFTVCVNRVRINCAQIMGCDNGGPDIRVLLRDASELVFSWVNTKTLEDLPLKDGYVDAKWSNDCPFKNVSYSVLADKGVDVLIQDDDGWGLRSDLAECTIKFEDKDIDSGNSVVVQCGQNVPELEFTIKAQ